MNKFLIIPFLLFGSVFAYPHCSQDLAPALRAIYRFPQGRKLIDEVEKSGPVMIYRAPFNSRSNAMWMEPDRAIVINARESLTFAEIVRSIFFELHNAKTAWKFSQLDSLASNYQLSKSAYIENVEWVEHQNAVTCSRLIDLAIRKGYFPSDAHWPISPDFNRHYEIQVRTGHTQKIAAMYDSLTRCNTIVYH